MKIIKQKINIFFKSKKFFLIKLFSFCLCLTFVVPLFSACGFSDTVNKAAKNLNVYSISAELIDETKTIVASEKVEYVNKTNQDLNSICFHLYGRAFRENATIKPYTLLNTAKCFPNGKNFGDLKVKAVAVDGVSTTVNLIGEDDDILSVNLALPLKPKGKILIEIAFELVISENTHRLGFFENTINLGNWFPIACVFENGQFIMDPYYSTGDPFYSDVSNFDVKFSFPNKYKVVFSGEKKSETTNGESVTIKIKAKAIRDFALVFGSNFETVSKKVGETTISYTGYVGDENLQENLLTSIRAFETFSKLFGEYPYTTLSVVKTNFLFGGMEYPNFVWIADNIDEPLDQAKVIAHEIAHQWWYGLVGNNEVSEPWLDEALAEYSTVLFFKENPEYKYTGAQMVQDASTSFELYGEIISSIGAKSQTSMILASNEYTTEYEYIYMVYVKGTLFFDSLKDKIGEKAFLKGLKIYFSKNKFKNAKAENLIGAFEKTVGYELKEFFDEWNEK